MLLECKIYIKDFSCFQNEIPEGQRIKVFVTMGSKNYSYDTEDIVTKEVVGRVTKIRGLCLRGDVSNAMDTNQLLEFVEKMQRNEKVEKAIPQLRLKINNSTKTISAEEIQSLYSNFSNDKRYYKASTNSTKLWPYGTTSYQT